MNIYDDSFLDNKIILQTKLLIDNEKNWIKIKSTNNIESYPSPENILLVVGDGPQDVHSASLHDERFSSIHDVGVELLNKFAKKHNITVKKILRVKANKINRNEGQNFIHPPHIDMHIPHFVFLYYVDESDGNTIIFNEKYSSKQMSKLTIEKEIKPKSGAAVVFNGLQYHSSSPPKISEKRTVININFMGNLNL